MSEPFEQKIAEIRSATANIHRTAQMTQADRKNCRQLEQLLLDLANRAKRADANLELRVAFGKTPTLTAGFLDSHFSTPRYSVGATCTQGTVEVQMSDGKWQEMPNQHGLWGNWSDQKVIFSGDYDEAPIREAIERTFVDWYHAVKRNALKGIPLQ